jgi:GTP1/Obg family GTP-binding protein
MWKSIVLAAALVGSPLAMAQTTAPEGAPPGSATTQLSPSTIQQAGHALRDVTSIRMDYSHRIQNEQDPGKRQELAQEAQGRQIQAVKAQGLSVEQFNQAMQVARADPQVKQRLLAAAGAQ